ncbi:MAG: hypothetical protein PHQ09_04700 [Actinomycetota bacterium]|nr:hypothetical protein [Actinomycetota bacterium]
MLEELRSEEARQLAEYYQEYGPVKAEFIEKTAGLSEKMNDRVTNTEELRKLAAERLEAVWAIRKNLSGLEIFRHPWEPFLFLSWNLSEAI